MKDNLNGDDEDDDKKKEEQEGEHGDQPESPKSAGSADSIEDTPGSSSRINPPNDTLSSNLSLGLSSVLILGLEWSGLKVASHLAQANVGKVVLVDDDQEVVRATLKKVTDSPEAKKSTTKFIGQELSFDAHLAEELIQEVDVVIDCLPNWQDKLIASDVCMHLRKTLIHAGGSGMRFQIYAMRPGKSACLRCAFPLAGIDDVPLIPETGSSLESIVAMVAAMQSLETIKILSRLGVSQGNELIKFDGLSGEFEVVRGLDPQHGCPDCGFAR